MSDDLFRRRYRQVDFPLLLTSLSSVIDLLRSTLGVLVLTEPIFDVRLDPSASAAIVEWVRIPSTADLVAVDAAVAAFVGGATTSAPLEFNSFGASTTTSTTPTDKIAFVTQPLQPGTYQVLWNSSIRMQAVAANTGVEGRIVLTRSDGANITQTDAWDLNVNHAFNGAITFQVLAGQTITGALRFARLGASGTAEMSGARVTVDKVS